MFYFVTKSCGSFTFAALLKMLYLFYFYEKPSLSLNNLILKYIRINMLHRGRSFIDKNCTNLLQCLIT